MDSWSYRSSTFAGTSSATRMSGTCVIAQSCSGADEESEAHYPRTLRHVEIGRARGPRDGEIHARPSASDGNSEAKAVVGFVHGLSARLERQDPMPVAEPHRKLGAEQTGRSHLRAHTVVPSIHGLDLRLRQAVHARPAVPLRVRRQ